MITYVPDFTSDITEGLIQIGGTAILVSKRSFGSEASGRIISKGISREGMASNRESTSWGFKFLIIRYLRYGSISLFLSTTSSSSAVKIKVLNKVGKVTCSTFKRHSYLVWYRFRCRFFSFDISRDKFSINQIS